MVKGYIRSALVLVACLCLTTISLIFSGSGLSANAEVKPPFPTPSASVSPAGANDPSTFLNAEIAQGMDCTLIVPANPLTAQGLATPYILDNNPNQTGCDMANAANLGAFVQATILNPATGQLYAYDPLVVTNGTVPAVNPPVPVLPPNAVVTIDTGFNGNILFLAGPGAQFFDTGLPGSPFGQVAFDNGPAFFAAANAAHLTFPILGTANGGVACPTVHAFNLVDQDPSDNVTTSYLVTASGQTAENNPTNAAMLPGAMPVNNGSDNLLIDKFLNPALNCTTSEFNVPSLSSPGTMEATQATDELFANRVQGQPVALVPPNDPMVTVGADDDIIAGDFPTVANLSIAKTDAYRAGIGQPPLTGAVLMDADQFCTNLDLAGAQVMNEEQFEVGFSSPLNTPLPMFMANRYNVSLQLLNCALFGNVSAGAQLVVPDTAGNGVTSTSSPNATPTASPTMTPSMTPSFTQMPTSTATPSYTSSNPHS